MHKMYFAILVAVELVLIVLLRRRSLRQTWLDNLIVLLASGMGGAAAFVETPEEFWRLLAGSLLLTGLGLEMISEEWAGRARLRLSLLIPVLIFSFSTFLNSPLLGGTEVFNITVALFTLIVLSDLPTFFRERTEVTSAHPLRAMRLVLGGGLAGYYVQTYIPTSRPVEAVEFWRWFFTGAGMFLMVLGFFLKSERRRQLLMAAWVGLFALWGIFSDDKALQLIGVFLASAGALSLVLAGDEPVAPGDSKALILKLGFGAVPGSLLFSVMALYFILHPSADKAHLCVWFIGLCMNWFAAARDRWNWERVELVPWTLRHRIGIFIVIAGTVVLILAHNVTQLVEMLQ